MDEGLAWEHVEVSWSLTRSALMRSMWVVSSGGVGVGVIFAGERKQVWE